MKWQPYAKLAANLLTNQVTRADVAYVTGSANWVVSEVARSLHQEIQLHNITFQVTSTARGLRSRLVHFGSLPTFFYRNQLRSTKPGQKNIVTIYHLIPDRHNPAELMLIPQQTDLIHTACTLTKQSLISIGVPERVIKVIPLGVDLDSFRPPQYGEREQIRSSLNIPPGHVVIGSFQKDGVGWGAGLRPKLEKGPDLFISVIAQVARQLPVFVLLVGPARGYVEQQLTAHGIPYHSVGFLKQQKRVARYYHALDFYLITSRIEGGPQSLLEAWASKVPVITMPVGMVPDIARHRHNALITEPANIEQLSKALISLIKNQALSELLTVNALRDATKFSWPTIAARYYNELYQPYLS